MNETHSYLDDSSFRQLYCSGDDQRSMKFYVEGIRCAKCVSKIENIKNQNTDLSTLEVDLAHQTATVELKNSDNSFAQFASAIDALGFRAIPLKPQDDPAEQWNLESRKDLIRIAVAAFCAGNIMMFAFAIYFGLEGDLKQIFEWLQLIFYIPVVSFVAWPFYRGLIQGLRSRTLSIDGPMAIASFLGFAVSTWNLVRNEGSIYYDSTAGFLFLILATRYFQKRTRFEYLRFLRPQSLSEIFKARLKIHDGWVWVPSTQLGRDQTVLVEKNEWVPADGILMSSQAVLDLSVLDGESRPRWVQKGFPIKAGSKLLSDAAEISVLKSGTQTLLGNLLSSLKSVSIDETDSSSVSNKASQWLLGVVLSLAFLTLSFGFFYDFETYFERAFALLVLACPCAMAFGTPLAFSFSMKKAQEKGMLIKSAAVFEKIRDIKNIYLDKTGTLTGRMWSLTSSSLEEVPVSYRQIILALEASSQHPVAFALRDIWSEVSELPEVENFEALTHGVTGTINGEFWKFCGFTENDQKWFGLFKNQELLWKFKLQSQLREGASRFVDFLRRHKMNIFLLSGDDQKETLRVAEILHIPRENCFSQLTPQEKAQHIKASSTSMMIGDGVNDSLALQNAQVSVAVQGAVDVALRSADVLLLNEDLETLQNLFLISKKARKQIRQNLSVALVYNIAGGVAALLGWINPFIAALLMPISSVFILATTWWGTRR